MQVEDTMSSPRQFPAELNREGEAGEVVDDDAESLLVSPDVDRQFGEHRRSLPRLDASGLA